VELDEVHVQFKNSIEDLETRIRQEEQNPGAVAQPLEERVARIVATCKKHIEFVIESSRIQADNAPGRPRRNRSANGQNPRSAAASPPGQKHSGQHLSLPQLEETQPQPIPKKRQQQRLSATSESSLSSSFDTANSLDSWAKAEQVMQGQHFDGHDAAATGDLSGQSLSQYTGLAIDTGHPMNAADMDDPLSAISAISAINTGPAGSPAHLLSPAMGHTGPVIPPPQARLRNMDENGFQGGSNGGQAPSPVANLMGSQLHHSRVDSGVAGFDATPSYFNGAQTYQNNGNMNMNMFPSNPNAFQPMPTTMRAYPASQIHHAHMQMRYRPQNAPVMHGGAGGTIDPRMIQHFSNAGPMGMGNNCNNGNGFNAFSPGGGDGAN